MRLTLPKSIRWLIEPFEGVEISAEPSLKSYVGVEGNLERIRAALVNSICDSYHALNSAENGFGGTFYVKLRSSEGSLDHATIAWQTYPVKLVW